MKHILLLGATGHLGNVVLLLLLKKKYIVTVLVRSPKKILTADKNLNIIIGDVTKKEDLITALKDIDVVISTLGHGFRTSFPIQKKTIEALVPLLSEKEIKRIIAITGAGLIVKGDSKSLLTYLGEKVFSLIDPYRISDARDQQLLLEKSGLDWTVVRTPIHASKGKNSITHAGVSQPFPWVTVSREAIANFMIDCIEKNLWVQKSPIIY